MSVPPIEDFQLYLKTFDIDDPFVETLLPGTELHVDPNDNGGNGIYSGTTINYTAEEDNRGSVTVEGTTSKAGVIMNTGNNSILYSSHLLTVWRILHIESESMLNYAWNNTIQQRPDAISDFNSSTNPQVFSQVDRINTSNITPGDPSSNLTTGGNGRFEMGQLIVGLVGVTPQINSIIIGQQNTPTIIGNGNNFIRFNAPQNLTNIWGELTGPGGGANIAVTITEVTKDGNDFVWELNGFLPPAGLTLNDFIGETIKVGGGSSIEITAADAANTTVTTERMSIAFIIRDDDQIPTTGLLPQAPDLSALTAPFEQAYIICENDGGGNFGNNQNALGFIENISNINHMASIDLERQSKPNETAPFWIVYITSAWQFGSISDGDPNNELAIELHWAGTHPAGVTTHDFNLSTGGQTSMIFREVIADIPPTLTEAEATAHEVGHQFGLDHGENAGIPEYPIIGLMGSGNSFAAGNNGAIIPLNLFIPRHLNLIRSRVNSPGH